MNLWTSTPPMLRQISVRAAMDILLHQGPTSRADLAKKTGLSKQTMSEVIRTLETAGWVRVKGIVSGKVGRSAVTYEVAPDAGFVIGMDIGATTIRVAIADIAGTIVHEVEKSAGEHGGEALLAHVSGVVEASLKKARVSRSKVLLAAVAMPGVIDPETGRLSLAPNLSEIGSLDVIKALQGIFRCDVIIENDVNAAVIGESWKGSGIGLDSVAFVSLGTGIGLGVLFNGKLMRGAKGAAGEIGYLPFGADPYNSESLERGALECAIGARGILERYGNPGDGGMTVRDILEAAEKGDAKALATVQETARLAALLVVSVHAMLDPGKIILGGNVGRNPLMVRMVKEALATSTRSSISLEASTLASRATLVGAVAIALNQLHNALFSPQDLPSEMRLPA
ncbi:MULTISPECIES: ROK family transcriptional regulator [Rhizobium/Agrobacterium group]|uniref:Transcriptional regulator ROK family n=3 Tax=Rhizobium/Agrobacterium group TaxID=227290 RepID=B9K0Z3_ALLAM|nr:MULTISPECIES: ROK family transcriptional regulator [Rhizobium/Agrobacterium group]ACM38541.1 transcriptional regulator ROK family [Allorhizobium ampelinum S4]MCF1445707.1 ROK family transcriptional regulator [Allorhizobium ampelinum]MUO26761.1 ROK family protein [Agrobacterium vitis]MUO41874.1 ROK family protein [Agrobacterium vitis]MUP10374.1 ROK family protein [Agrobacterium vitis]